MFKISKESIKPLAADEATYYRGLRYYKNNAVSNVTWSKASQQYRALVKGGNKYMVAIDMNEQEEIHYSCNCPGHIKYQGACKHVIAVLLFIEHYMDRAEGKQPETPEEKNILQVIDYFEKREEGKIYGETFELAPILSVPALLKDTSKAYASFQAGSSRFYKIQNIKKFFSDIRQNQAIHLGKDFQFFPGESRFSPESQIIFDYLMEIYEIQETLGKIYSSSLFAKSEISFSKNMFYKLLTLLNGHLVKLILSEKSYEDVCIHLGNPPIGFHLDLNGNNLVFDFQESSPVTPLSEDGSILFYKNCIYLPDKEFVLNYLPFYTSLGKDRGPLVFSGINKNKFLEKVLPKIHETMKVEIPEKVKNQFISGKPNAVFYLDRCKSFIRLKLVFRYGNHQVNPLTGETPEDILILREQKYENEIIQKLERMHFVPYQDSFLLKKEDFIYQFLSEEVVSFAKEFEVYYTNEFKTLSIQKPGSLHSSIRYKREKSLLELELSYDNIPIEERKELLHSLQQKKTYHRLRNGSFINLQTKEIQYTKEILHAFYLTEKEFSQKTISIPSSQAVYLDSLLSQMDEIDYQKDKGYFHLIQGILSPEKKEYSIPTSIQASLRSYQVTGYKWMKTLADANLGGILADDMGLGKTLQSIAFIASVLETSPNELFFIVCPTSLVYNWQEEFQKFAPAIVTCIVSGTPEEREKIIKEKGMNQTPAQVFFTSYPLLRRDMEKYKNITFHTIFTDEAQYIKNAGSQNAKAVKHIRAKHRFALTGTPIENSLWELWSIFDFILPSYLFSHNKFAEQYEKPIIRNGDQNALDDLGKKIHPFILRRLKKDVLKELPDKIESKMICHLTLSQRSIYLEYLEKIKNEFFPLKSETMEFYPEKKSMEILAALTRLRQICCHPSMFLENYKGGSGKLELLMELLDHILEGGHRVLIFSQFTSMLRIIEKEFRHQEIEYFFLEGMTKPGDRKDYVNRFNQGERSVFLISLKAGGTGLNLTGADTVIHYDPWWNPAVEDQATDRAYRIGQNKSVQVIKLIAKDTIEEKIYLLQQKKKEISNAVIQKKEVFINHLTKEELLEIFS